jgi:hypothetical protein
VDVQGHSPRFQQDSNFPKNLYLFPCPGQSDPQCQGVLAILGKDFQASPGFFLWIKPVRHYLSIILKLERITTIEELRGPEDHLQQPLMLAKDLLVTPFFHDFFSDIHRVNKPRGDLFGEKRLRRVGIGEIGKQQPLQKRPHLPRDVAEIDGGAQNEGIRGLHLFQNRRQAILDGTFAITFAFSDFTGKATRAAGKSKIDQRQLFFPLNDNYFSRYPTNKFLLTSLFF